MKTYLKIAAIVIGFVLVNAGSMAQGLKPAIREKVTPPASKNKFHLFLLVGQSNMAGRGYPEAQDTTPNRHVLTLNKTGEWEIAKDPIHFDKTVAGVGPGLAFGKTLAEADTSVIIGLIPCAVGGSGIDYWKAGIFYPQTKTNAYDDAIARAKVAMQSGVLTGIIWHQGEADSGEGKSSVYADKLEKLIATFRQDLDAPAVPFVAGELPDFQIHQQDSTGKKTENIYAIEVNKAIESLKGKVVNYSYVTAEGTQHRGDVLHFNAVSARLMGRRYALEMQKLLLRKKK